MTLRTSQALAHDTQRRPPARSRRATLIGSLELAKSRIQIMIDKGMEHENGMLQSLIDKADARIAEIQSGAAPALHPKVRRGRSHGPPE